MSDDVEWIRQGLQSSGKNQSALARHLGLSHTQISRLLHGKRRLQLSEIALISSFLGVRPPISPVNLHPGNVLPGVKVIGIIADGLWFDPSSPVIPNMASQPATASDRYINDTQHGFALHHSPEGEPFSAGTILNGILVPDDAPLLINHYYVVCRKKESLMSWALVKFEANGFRAIAPPSLSKDGLERSEPLYLIIGGSQNFLGT